MSASHGPTRTTPATTIIIVLRHSLIRDAVTRLLADDGFRVLADEGTYAGGYTAITTLRPHIAILDDRFPDGDGLSLCRAVTALDPAPLVVLYATLPGPGSEQAARDAGAAAHIVKTIDTQNLRLTLATFGAHPRAPGTTPLEHP